MSEVSISHGEPVSRTGRRNRSQVLRTLYAQGPMSRAELASMIGTARASMSQTVQPLVDAMLLEERNPLPSSELGGRRARPLWFSRNNWTMAGVYLLPGTVHAAVVSAGGDVLARAARPFEISEASPDLIVAAIGSVLDSVLADSDADVRGVGIAVPGMVDTESGEVVAVNLMPRLAGMALASRIQEWMSLPVHIDQHPRAQALGDLLFGEGRKIPSFLSLYTGDALGAGLVLDGKLHRGPSGAGGEVGHTLVDLGGARCHCGRRGCWETIATIGWMRRRAAELEMSRAADMTTNNAREQARDGVAAAGTLLSEYRRHLAYGIADLYQTLAPQAVLLHGDVVDGGEEFRAALEEEVKALVPFHPGAQPRLILAQDEENATVRGAAAIALFHSLDLDT